jgi:hypothetical protein
MFSWNISISITTGYGQADWDSKPNRRKGLLFSPSTAFYLKGTCCRKVGDVPPLPLHVFMLWFLD